MNVEEKLDKVAKASRDLAEVLSGEADALAMASELDLATSFRAKATGLANVLPKAFPLITEQQKQEGKELKQRFDAIAAFNEKMAQELRDQKLAQELSKSRATAWKIAEPKRRKTKVAPLAVYVAPGGLKALDKSEYYITIKAGQRVHSECTVQEIDGEKWLHHELGWSKAERLVMC